MNVNKHQYLWHIVGSFFSYINDARSHEPETINITSYVWLYFTHMMILYNTTGMSHVNVTIHNSVSVTKESKYALNIEFTQRGHQWCTLFIRMKGQKHSYYHGISVCFNKPCTLWAEMKSKICIKFTLTADLEQNSM